MVIKQCALEGIWSNLKSDFVPAKLKQDNHAEFDAKNGKENLSAFLFSVI